MRETLKKIVCDNIDQYAQEVINCIKDIGQHAELGFKEERTAGKVAEFFAKHSLPYRDKLALTGVRSTIGEGDINIAVLGEMDAVVCGEHPDANDKGAAHACGHNLQLGCMLAVASAFADKKVLKELPGKITFFAVPAEEYVEIEYRRRLIDEGKIRYFAGKQELIALGEFDDINMAMMMHAESNRPQKSISIGTSSNGFIGKSIQYLGKASHAAESPDKGVNALNAAMLGLMGIHALRETFRDEDAIRVHPIITKGGDLVNSVPADVRIETYVRAKTMQAIENTHHKVDQALKAGAAAIGAEVIIDTAPGYLPIICNETMNEMFIENTQKIQPDVQINRVGHFSASLDFGDVSHLLPVIHPFIGGVDGNLHAKNFCVVDYYSACILPAKAMAMMIVDLLMDDAQKAKQILADFTPVYTKDEYLKTLDSYFSKG